MFLGGDVSTDAPTLVPLKLTVAKEVALKKVQEVFLEGRQINALYICTFDELGTAKQRKLQWLGQVNEVLTSVCAGTATSNFVDEVAINVLRDKDPIESHSELFHNELNQRLERLRLIRRGIEDASDPAAPNSSKRDGRPGSPSSPVPKPLPGQELASPQGGNPSPMELTDGASPVLSAALSCDDDLNLKGSNDKMEPLPSAISTPRLRSGPIQPTHRALPVKVLLLLVSRNGTARQALCRFAAQVDIDFEIIDFNPEQPHSIVEHMYRHRDAKFAVVYWADPIGPELPGSAHPERYVGFSLGFVLGRLGRGRVFIIGSTTTPPLPGFARILVAQLDMGGGWQIQLARRMKAAGIDVDLNRLA